MIKLVSLYTLKEVACIKAEFSQWRLVANKICYTVVTHSLFVTDNIISDNKRGVTKQVIDMATKIDCY